jgi:hypothetical protein
MVEIRKEKFLTKTILKHLETVASIEYSSLVIFLLLLFFRIELDNGSGVDSYNMAPQVPLIVAAVPMRRYRTKPIPTLTLPLPLVSQSLTPSPMSRSPSPRVGQQGPPLSAGYQRRGRPPFPRGAGGRNRKLQYQYSTTAWHEAAMNATPGGTATLPSPSPSPSFCHLVRQASEEPVSRKLKTYREFNINKN